MQTNSEHKTENWKCQTVKVLISAVRLRRTLSFFQMMQSIDFRITFVKPFLRNIIFYFDLLQMKKKIPELIRVLYWNFMDYRTRRRTKLKSIQNLFWDWSIILADYIMRWSRYLNSLSWVNQFGQSLGGMFF